MGKVTLACILLLACVVAEISCIPLARGFHPHYAGCNHLYYPGLECLAGSYYNYNYCGCQKPVVSNVKVVSGKGLCLSRADQRNERAYLLLDNGIPTRMWCAPGTIYSAGICGCTHPPKAPEPEAPKPVAKADKPAKCLSHANVNGGSTFFVNVHGVETKMFCAPGTAYSQADCSCSITLAKPASAGGAAGAASADSSDSSDSSDEDGASADAAAAASAAAAAAASADAVAAAKASASASAAASADAAAAAAAAASSSAVAVPTAPKEEVDPALAAAVAATGPMCHNLPDPSDHRAYFVFEHGKKKKMLCAPGSLYSPVTCACGVNLLSAAAGHHVRAGHPPYPYAHNWPGYHSAYYGAHGYHGYPGYYGYQGCI